MQEAAESKRESDAAGARLEEELRSAESRVEGELSSERRKTLQEKQRVRLLVESRIRKMSAELLSKKVPPPGESPGHRAARTSPLRGRSSSSGATPGSRRPTAPDRRRRTGRASLRRGAACLLVRRWLRSEAQRSARPSACPQEVEITDKTARAARNNDKLRAALQAKASQAQRLVVANQGLAFENVGLQKDIELAKASEVKRNGGFPPGCCHDPLPTPTKTPPRPGTPGVKATERSRGPSSRYLFKPSLEVRGGPHALASARTRAWAQVVLGKRVKLYHNLVVGLKIQLEKQTADADDGEDRELADLEESLAGSGGGADGLGADTLSSVPGSGPPGSEITWAGGPCNELVYGSVDELRVAVDSLKVCSASRRALGPPPSPAPGAGANSTGPYQPGGGGRPDPLPWVLPSKGPPTATAVTAPGFCPVTSRRRISFSSVFLWGGGMGCAVSRSRAGGGSSV